MKSRANIPLILLLILHSTLAEATNSTNAPDHPHNADNSSNHHGDNSSDHHGGNDTHHAHHGIHVASIRFDYVRQPLIVAMFMIAVVLVKLAFHHANFLSSWMPESCVLIVLGIAVGGILHALKVDTSTFYYIEPDSFFLFLLPPIILEAAYGLHDIVFFANLGTILFYAVIGTLINCFLIGPILYGLAMCGAMGFIEISMIECLVFSSLIVAVDPVAVLAIFQEVGVNSVLYFLVFGESLLNDAVTVVIYNTIVTLSQFEEEIPLSEIGLAIAAFFTVSLGGLTIGILYGVISALITRLMTHVRVIEPLAILSLAYAAYLTAELFHFSGIISTIGCGLMQVEYAFHNISSNSTITVKYFIKMLSCACDSIIFMFLGVALIRDDHVWQTGFILWSAFLCLAIRFLVTYSLTFIANRVNRNRKITNREQFIMAYGGLRGAVAFCLVAMLDEKYILNKNLFQTATLFVVLFTVFIQGITIRPLVKLLNIESDEEKVVSMCTEINNHVIDHMLVFMEEVIGHYGHNSIQEKLNSLNDRYLKKMLLREPFTKDEVIMGIYQQIILQQHYENLYGQEGDGDSHLNLYKPNIANAMMDSNAQPELIRMSFEDALANLISKRQSTMKAISPDIYSNEDTIGPFSPTYDTTKSLPEYLMSKQHKKGPAVERTISVEVAKSKDKWKSAKTRIRLVSQVSRSKNNSLDFAPRATKVEDIRSIFIKSANKDAFSRRNDINLKEGDRNDLVKLLADKQRRHTRYQRCRSLAYDQALSEVNSINERQTSLDLVERGQVKEQKQKHKSMVEATPNQPMEQVTRRFLKKRPGSSINPEKQRLMSPTFSDSATQGLGSASLYADNSLADSSVAGNSGGFNAGEGSIAAESGGKKGDILRSKEKTSNVPDGKHMKSNVPGSNDGKGGVSGSKNIKSNDDKGNVSGSKDIKSNASGSKEGKGDVSGSNEGKSNVAESNRTVADASSFDSLSMESRLGDLIGVRPLDKQKAMQGLNESDL